MVDQKVVLAARPSAGVWYYVFDGVAWGLRCWRANEAPYTGHPEVWEHVIVPELAMLLGLDGFKAALVGQLPYCMPRGRVDATLDEDGSYNWVLYHGGDFPGTLDLESERRKLVSYFNLTGPFLNGKAKFAEVGHEKMLEQEKAKFREATGISVPY